MREGEHGWLARHRPNKYSTHNIYPFQGLDLWDAHSSFSPCFFLGGKQGFGLKCGQCVSSLEAHSG